MSYAAVITHVRADAEAAPRLACAVDIAERFGAVLIGVAAEKAPVLHREPYGWRRAAADATAEWLRGAHVRFNEATTALSDRAQFCSEMDLPGPAVAAVSRIADLIVAGGAPRDIHNAHREASPAHLALTSGRPVLLAPPAAPPLSAKQVLLVWDDSREARRAMTDAMPFFERAERIVVTALCPGREAGEARAEVDAIAAALRRRSINAEAAVVEHAHPDGVGVLRQAGLERADLIVCGANGHDGLGGWAFSGLAGDLAAQDQAYVLLSH